MPGRGGKHYAQAETITHLQLPRTEEQPQACSISRSFIHGSNRCKGNTTCRCHLVPGPGGKQSD